MTLAITVFSMIFLILIVSFFGLFLFRRNRLGMTIYQFKRNIGAAVGLALFCGVFLFLASQAVVFDFGHLIPIVHWHQPWIAILETPIFMFDLLMLAFWILILPIGLYSNLQAREIRTDGIIDPIIVWRWQDLDSFRFNPESGNLEFQTALRIFGRVKTRVIRWKVPADQKETITGILTQYLPCRSHQ